MNIIILFIVFSINTSREGDTLSIDDCIEIALKNSPLMEVAKGSLKKSELGIGDARATLLPDVELKGGYYLNKTFNKIEWNENHYDLKILASIQPFNSGRTYLGIERAVSNFHSAEESFRDIKMSLILEVIRRYYALLRALRILDLRERALEQKQKQLDFSKAQFRLGLVPRADTLKARVSLEGAKLNLQEASGELLIRKIELNEIMGLKLDSSIIIEDVEIKEPEIPDFDSILEVAYRKRPDLKRQEFLISASKCDLLVSKINMTPTLTVIGGYNIYAEKFLFQGVPLNKDNLEDNSDWSVGLNLSFPIFDGGKNYRAISRASIEFNNAKLEYENLKREVELEVKRAYINLENTKKKIELSQREVISARESYEAAIGRYKNGLAPITEVIDAEVLLTEAEVNLVESKYEFLEANALLKKAMGVLYEEEE
ncbi:MAG: TolC family protein [candidate division WOR-3 bacterium]